jgi:hypothetical protein
MKNQWLFLRQIVAVRGFSVGCREGVSTEPFSFAQSSSWWGILGAKYFNSASYEVTPSGSIALMRKKNLLVRNPFVINGAMAHGDTETSRNC